MSEIDWASLYEEASTILEGEFPAVVKSAESARTSTDKPCIKAKVVIESGAYAGREFNHMFTITADNAVSMRIFISQMKVLGLGPEFFAAKPSTEMIAQAIVGKRTTIKLEKKTWNGEDRENITRWAAASGVAPLGAITVASGPALGAGTATGLPAAQALTVSTPTSALPADPF